MPEPWELGNNFMITLAKVAKPKLSLTIMTNNNTIIRKTVPFYELLAVCQELSNCLNYIIKFSPHNISLI